MKAGAWTILYGLLKAIQGFFFFCWQRSEISSLYSYKDLCSILEDGVVLRRGCGIWKGLNCESNGGNRSEGRRISN